MLRVPNDGYTAFDVAIYNKDVRALVKENRHHLFFDDQWADVHVQDVAARDEQEARSLIAERFPPEDGFVIDGLSQSRV